MLSSVAVVLRLLLSLFLLWTTKAAALSCPRFRANQSRNRPMFFAFVCRVKKKADAASDSDSSSGKKKSNNDVVVVEMGTKEDYEREHQSSFRPCLLLLRRRAGESTSEVRHRGKSSASRRSVRRW